MFWVYQVAFAHLDLLSLAFVFDTLLFLPRSLASCPEQAIERPGKDADEEEEEEEDEEDEESEERADELESME